MAKKKSKTGKIVGVALLVGAGVAGYFLYREHKKAGGVWGIGLTEVERKRRQVSSMADRYAMKADIYRTLMGKR